VERLYLHLEVKPPVPSISILTHEIELDFRNANVIDTCKVISAETGVV